ncbi:MAG: IgA Peptidase M64 [Acidobacteria bacterium]|nr:IgA Peptidase M64 [Acidobacteriota bacterium]
MRVDYFHTGNAFEERFSLDGVVVEGPWPGPIDRWIDETNLGKYQFQVTDRRTNRQLYSRGFASVFGEWETTAEAKMMHRTYHESLRFPVPGEPFRLVLKKRDRQNAFREVWSIVIDPDDPTVDRTGQPLNPKYWAVMRYGEPRDKVDILLVGDGYTAGEMDKWRRDARRMADMLFAVSPFKERRKEFNIWALDTPADESGIARPSDRVYRRSPVRASYDAFGLDRYILTFDNKRLREIAAAAPYEFVGIIANDRKYGGGGIHNQYATVAADNAFASYIFVHEFGHHFAGLADEYYIASVAYETSGERIEPWEPNVTTDPQAERWKDLIAPGIPLPTPWPKEAFEDAEQEFQARRRRIRSQSRSEEEMEMLFREEQDRITNLLASAAHAGKVGSFEGAMYQAKGYYRPQVDCIMFTRNAVGFCAVCRRAIERVIDLYTNGKGP